MFNDKFWAVKQALYVVLGCCGIYYFLYFIVFILPTFFGVH